MSTPQTHDAADRARRLQRVAELLAEAVTPQEVLDAILTDGVRAAEAHAGAIGVLSADGKSIELLRLAHLDGLRAEPAQHCRVLAEVSLYRQDADPHAKKSSGALEASLFRSGLRT